MAIEKHEDVESGYLHEPFIQPEDAAAACKENGSDKIYLLNNEVPQEAIIIMKTSRQNLSQKELQTK